MVTINKRTLAAIAASASLLLSVPFIGQWEGKRNDPYKDIVGVSTVCYGETRVTMRHYTDEECTAMLEKAVDSFRKDVVACTPSLEYRPFQLAAATSLSYNVGVKGYCGSTAAKRFNAGDYKGGCEALTWWNKAGGKVVQGLVNRRKEEYEICMKGL